MKSLAYPVCNLNGSKAQSLLNENRKASDALRVAQDALREICPHGRDYQCQAPEVYNQARQEHIERQEKLNSLIEELDAIAENLYSQIPS